MFWIPVATTNSCYIVLFYLARGSVGAILDSFLLLSGAGPWYQTDMTDRDSPKVRLREPCKCGSALGHVQPKKTQLVVRCAKCNSYAFCCPHAELAFIAVKR